MDPAIFKAYDIRGIYPDQIDDFEDMSGARPTPSAFASVVICGPTAKRWPGPS
ncbi:MAG: hypothetical protein ACYSWR_07200 [Planctomycetota bacterium]